MIQYLHTSVALNLREFELPYLRFCYNAAHTLDPDQLCALDEEIGVAKASKELRHASASQGQQRLRLLHKLRPSRAIETIARLKQEKRLVPHHLLVFAVEHATKAHPTPLEAALLTWAYQALAAPCAASLKLIRIGQEAAQLALSHALGSVESIVTDSLSVDRRFSGAFLPALDIAAHRHERANARLFIS